MKEILAGFAADIFRPVVTLLIPGFWALTPWTVAMFLLYPATWRFANIYSDGSGLAFVVMSTAAGLIFEDLGVRIEAIFFKLYGYDRTNWFAYLRRADATECIGTRYIRTLVLRLKFEQGMGAAGPIAFIGVLCIPVSGCMKCAFCILITLITSYLVYEARCSVKLLEDIRIAIK